MEGFFTRSEMMQVRAPKALAPRCGACGLYKTCLSPKMARDGEGRKTVLVVGEAPGEQEDKQGRPLVGKSGRKLADTLAQLGHDLREDCWLYNSVICRPPGNDLSKHPKAVEHCAPNVVRTIRELRPSVVILLGGTAVRSVIGRIWKDDPGGIGRWVGWRIPSREYNCWVCPTYHPSYLLREENPVLDRLFARHLKGAFNKAGTRPFSGPLADPADQVEILSPRAAAARLNRYRAGTIAFDYENDRLKPDAADARIVCASVCWEGQETIAFPWDGPVVEAFTDLLANPDVGKIASNLKHEHRWTRKLLGVRVRNWVWDTMLAAHALDSRGGISSIKFQAFVRRGVPDYAHHVHDFLAPSGREEDRAGGNAPNRIHEISLDLLLKYCGVDSLLEYEVAMEQMAELGHAR